MELSIIIGDGISVGEVDVYEAQAACFCFYVELDIAGLFVRFIARESCVDYAQRRFGEDGDAVIGFLSDAVRVVAEGLESVGGKV